MTSKLTITDQRLAEIHAECEERDPAIVEIGAMIEELQERRKADREPVAEVVSIYGDPEAFGEREIRSLVGIQKMPYGTKLYRHAQPAPDDYQHLKNVQELYHGQEKRLFKIAQRIKGPAFDKYSHSPSQAIDVLEAAIFGEDDACRAAMPQAQSLHAIKAAPELGSRPKVGEVLHANSPVIPDDSADTKRLDWLDAQNKRLNEYYGTSYGWKFDANFQRNAMMLNDSNYPAMTVRQAIDEAIAAAPTQENI
ncbi:hypothetical protein LVT46_04870 [Klebsiella quasipneumoniae subsp. similipneumoniae]|uniref:hypothetical protein n=1 Tax=Klebsiella quasipneumoniae TaxID=1463165 RepID=UPI001E5A6A57|nr:hypothetical protein [Klebsiella quasipneumoniae]MCD9997634.1 hypothetical protein [Klebsiella quasipneumoniae subsp. similipneumoniae]